MTRALHCRGSPVGPSGRGAPGQAGRGGPGRGQVKQGPGAKMIERMRQQNKPVTPQMEKMAAWMDGMQDTEAADGMVGTGSRPWGSGYEVPALDKQVLELDVRTHLVSDVSAPACETRCCKVRMKGPWGHLTLSAMLVVTSSAASAPSLRAFPSSL